VAVGPRDSDFVVVVLRDSNFVVVAPRDSGFVVVVGLDALRDSGFACGVDRSEKGW
jgi:hypothetical protein